MAIKRSISTADVLFIVSMSIIVLLTCATQAAAQAFPAKEVELIIGYGPGGSTDTMARIIGDKVSKVLGVPIVFTNKPGGSAAIAASYVATAKPDGYTIGTAGETNLGLLLATEQNIPYTLDDFAGIARAITSPMVIIAKKGHFDSFKALVKEAQKRPGEIMFASWGAKSSGHIAGELMNLEVGMKMKHVPFESGAKGMVGVLGGHVDIAVVTLATCKENLRAGTLDALAVFTPDRAEELPAIPTLKELGYPDATFVGADGFITSSKVPQERLTILRAAFEKSMKDPEVLAALTKVGMTPYYQNGKEFESFLRKNLELYKEVIKKTGM
jgi:tripartite-type tricarboxylate transporter receptor subunit TctC